MPPPASNRSTIARRGECPGIDGRELFRTILHELSCRLAESPRHRDLFIDYFCGTRPGSVRSLHRAAPDGSLGSDRVALVVDLAVAIADVASSCDLDATARAKLARLTDRLLRQAATSLDRLPRDVGHA
jgi:hypothetical protein